MDSTPTRPCLTSHILFVPMPSFLLTTSSAKGFLASLTMLARKPASTGTLPSYITRDAHRPPIAHPASKMEMSVKPCARRRAAACTPAAPAPITTTFLAFLVLLSCQLVLAWLWTAAAAGDAEDDDMDDMGACVYLFLFVIVYLVLWVKLIRVRIWAGRRNCMGLVAPRMPWPELCALNVS